MKRVLNINPNRNKNNTVKFYSISFITLLFFVSGFTVNLKSQIQSKGYPILYSLKSATNIPTIQIDVDLNRLKSIEEENNLKVLKVAKKIETDIDCYSDGKWSEFGRLDVWHIKVKAEGAKSMGLHFSNYRLPDGAKLFIIDKDHNVKGAFTGLNNKTYGSLAIAPMKGEELLLELQVPHDVYYNPELKIDNISYGFVDDISNTALKSQACNVDVNCYNVDTNIMVIKNAVCKILANGEDFCTGTLINNTSNNLRYYMLTANHCISSEAAAKNSIFYFNFEAPYCNGPLISPENTISGATLISTKKYLDFTLIELSTDPPYHYNPYMAGWDLDTTHIENTKTIHHPSGDIKKISIDNNSPVISSFSNSFDKNAFWNIIKWEVGTTEGGSSGAPLFDQNYKLIGTLTGGLADCSNSIDDYFARFDQAWDKYPVKEEQLTY